MFKYQRDVFLDIAFFLPEGYPNSLHVVEMWKYRGQETWDDRNFRQMAISEHDVPAWIGQKGPFAPPKGPNEVLEGGIRLVLCDRNSYRPPGFAMTRECFLTLQKGLGLPLSLLESAFMTQGVFSRQITYSKADRHHPQSIAFSVKAPQKMPIANYALACTYDFGTGITTAFVHGSFLHSPLPTVTLDLHSRALDYTSTDRHNIYAGFQSEALPHELTQSLQLIDRLRNSMSQWTNSLLLPAIILENYTTRSDLFAMDADDQLVALERQTGVVFAARSVRSEEMGIRPFTLPRQRVHSMTQDMHTLLTEAINFERVVDWISDYSKWLIVAASEIDTILRDDEQHITQRREMVEFVEFSASGAIGRCGAQKALKERIQWQINVLHSFIAQLDSSTSAKIAVSSARDSSAMKTLALVTLVFLPGTYVATLFSMTFFDWSDDPIDGPHKPYSKKFWIYWTLTIPLTLVVIALWRIWWVWQEKTYQREVDRVTGMTKEDEDSSETAPKQSQGAKEKTR